MKSSLPDARTTTTVLRVKRPRHVAPLPTIQLDMSHGKRSRKGTGQNGGTIAALSQLLKTATFTSVNDGDSDKATNINDVQDQSHKNKPSTTTVWKRMGDASSFDKTATLEGSNKRIRYVDARLDDDNNGGTRGAPKKRRRMALTLLQEKSNSESKIRSPLPSSILIASPTKKNVVLDPVSRMVDDSLHSVFAGKNTVSDHVHYVLNDYCFIGNEQSWLAWSTSRKGGGTILHAAALYNDVQSTQTILSMPHWQDDQVQMLLSQIDGQGQTPQQVAQLVGHDSVVEILDSYCNTNDTVDAGDDADFVYDVFCLQETHSDSATNGDTLVKHSANDTSAPEENDKGDNHVTPTLDLRGGVGYWNERGELILEPMEDIFDGDDSLVLEDDVDSNCEEYDGNDYPDEESSDNYNGIVRRDDDPWEDSSTEQETTFRNRPSGFTTGAMHRLEMGRDGKVGVVAHGGDDETFIHDGRGGDSNDDGYEITNDVYENHLQDEPKRMYAYDPDLDAE